jgi:hypothetical protein
MLKNITNIAVFGAFLIVVGFLGIVLWQSLFPSEKVEKQRNEPQATHAEQQGSDEQAVRAGASPRAHNPTEDAIAEYTKWLAVFTALLVLATISLFVSGERNVDAARESAKAAKEAADAARDSVRLAESTAERQLRAYIGFDWGAVLLNSPADGQITAWMRLKNFGTTPAYKVKAWLRFSRLPSGDIPFDKTQEAVNDSILFPNLASNLFGTLSNNADQIKAVTDQTLSLFVWGRAEYVDAFGKPHFFSFKGKMSGPPTAIISEGREGRGWGFTPVENGIEAD